MLCSSGTQAAFVLVRNLSKCKLALNVYCPVNVLSGGRIVSFVLFALLCFKSPLTVVNK